MAIRHASQVDSPDPPGTAGIHYTVAVLCPVLSGCCRNLALDKSSTYAGADPLP